MGGKLNVSDDYDTADSSETWENFLSQKFSYRSKKVTTDTNRIYSKNGIIYAEFDGTQEVVVYTLSGGLVKKQIAARAVQFGIPQGFYIVTVGGTVYKVFVHN
ncbi:MAG: hypothetical protein LBF08_07590 [Dysgonamonadaceae bacterium]|nr:hypothetical protein [Dysgonamonadaceae bacterium]